jgi:hypothetical protein
MKAHGSFRRLLHGELKARQSRNPRYSLRAFANYLGIAPATLSQLLRGKRRMTERTIRKLGFRLALDETAIGSYLVRERHLAGRARATSMRKAPMGRPVVQWQMITRNPEKVADFYAGLFGWEINTNNAMQYRMVDTGSARGINGGIWPAPPEAPSFVQLFIEVDNLSESVAAATALGAKVVIPPTPLPDGDELAILHDPDGMSFGMYVSAAL